MQRFLHELAARHGVTAEDLIEAWNERAAIREHLAGFTRRAAEVFAVGDPGAVRRPIIRRLTQVILNPNLVSRFLHNHVSSRS
jgi:hypothetical protein